MAIKNSEDGFSLIEVAIIMIIAGLLLSTFFQMKGIVSAEQKRNEFYATVDILGDSLEQYALINGFYPAPASLTENFTNANFGQQVAVPAYTAAQCAAGSAMFNGIFCRPGQRDLDTSGTVGDIETETVLIGALPTSILGLNNEEAADMYQQRFTYAVRAI